MTDDRDVSQPSEHGSSTETRKTTVGMKRTLVPSSRRRVLQALGIGAAGLAFAGSASADELDDDTIEYSPDENQRPEGFQGDGEGVSYTRISDQVTDGTYAIIDEVNIVPEEGGFAEIHAAHPIPGIDATDPGFIAEDGSAQNAFGNALGYSEFLPQGLYQNVKVPLFEDENFDAVDGSVDRLKEPTVVVSLPHIDSNGNEEYDNYEAGAPDPAFGSDADDIEEGAGDVEGIVGAPNDGAFAPPDFNRPTDVAALIPLKENAEDFHIFRPEDGQRDAESDDSDGHDDAH